MANWDASWDAILVRADADNDKHVISDDDDRYTLSDNDDELWKPIMCLKNPDAWQELSRKAMRLRFRRRLWGLFGNWLKVIKARCPPLLLPPDLQTPPPLRPRRRVAAGLILEP